MSLNLQKELLEFQKELKELNSYSAEMKRMEKGLTEAEALTKVATKAAERISTKHREHLLETKNELSKFLSDNTSANKQLIQDFTKQFTQQIKLELERVGPLVNTLEQSTQNHLQEYKSVLINLQSIVRHLGPELEKHVAELQEQSQNTVESLSSSLLSHHTKHSDSVTSLLQDKTNHLISAGEALQAQSKSQGKEMAKVLEELYKASEFLANVSESISKTDFSAQLQGVEKELSSANTALGTIEDSVNQKSSEILAKLTSGNRELENLLQNGFEDTLAGKEDLKQLSIDKFESLSNENKQLEKRLINGEEASANNFTASNSNIKRIEKEIRQQIETLEEHNNKQFELLRSQLNMLKQLLVASISISGLLLLGWIGSALF